MTSIIPTTIGVAEIATIVYNSIDQSPLLQSLTARIEADPRDAAAWLDLSTLAQLNGNREHGLALQARALEITRVYRRIHGDGSALRVLAVFIPGDFMANTPLDFLFDGAHVTVFYAYISAGEPVDLAAIDYDLVFLGVAEADANTALLEELDGATQAWSRPVINADAAMIIQLKRNTMWTLFASSRWVAAPRNVRVSRSALLRLAAGTCELGELLPAAQFPILVRPLDSHAGQGLAKIDNAAALQAYLDQISRDVFYIAPFVDYSSADGRYRKYRIVFIAGRPYLAHLAISDDWMVHYLNAGMHDDAAKREEEARCMERFEEDFSVRHTHALRDVATRIPLEYFAVDCAETSDGRLLLFEAGTGMIVHSLDSPEFFPYKQRQMKRIFAAFLEMLARAAPHARTSTRDVGTERTTQGQPS